MTPLTSRISFQEICIASDDGKTSKQVHLNHTVYQANAVVRPEINYAIRVKLNSSLFDILLPTKLSPRYQGRMDWVGTRSPVRLASSVSVPVIDSYLFSTAIAIIAYVPVPYNLVEFVSQCHGK